MKYTIIFRPFYMIQADLQRCTTYYSMCGSRWPRAMIRTRLGEMPMYVQIRDLIGISDSNSRDSGSGNNNSDNSNSNQ